MSEEIHIRNMTLGLTALCAKYCEDHNMIIPQRFDAIAERVTCTACIMLYNPSEPIYMINSRLKVSCEEKIRWVYD